MNERTLPVPRFLCAHALLFNAPPSPPSAVAATGQMDSFAVLAALDNGWPLESMCLENFHFNANRPARGAALLETLRPEATPLSPPPPPTPPWWKWK